MKERLKVVIPYSISISALFALVLLFMFSGPNRINERKCARIKQGMTQRQVESILGGPPGDYGTGQREIVIGAVNINSSEDDERVEDWGGDDGIIQVTFDRRGRVISAYYTSDELWERPIPRRPPRKWTAIERWLGFDRW